MISRNTAAAAHTEATYMAVRYCDLIKKTVEESGDEIAARIIKAVAGGTQ